MPLPIAEFLALAAACAPTIPAQTLTPLIRVESAFNPLAVHVNGEPRIVVRARSRAEAVAKARALIAGGRSVDLGLGQINSRNLGWLRLSVEDAFDPCRNLTAAARVLQDGYRRAARDQSDPQAALRTAFSIYNTGHPERGFGNGYVARITRAAGVAPPRPATADQPRPAAAAAPPTPPAWDVFGQANAGDVLLLRISPVAADRFPLSAPGDLP